MAGGEETGRIRGERVYRGRVIDVDLDRVRFPDGSEGELEIIRHPGASAVVPLDPPGTDGAGSGQPIVVLIRQYRYAADGFVWEVPAGKLDPGESPESCAQRELEEETGYRARQLERLTTIHTTPGFTDEVIHLFMGRELSEGRSRHGDSEFIERHAMALDEAIEMVRSGDISDAKTICALLLARDAIAREARPDPGPRV